MSQPEHDPPPLRAGLFDDVMAAIEADPSPSRNRLRGLAAGIALACLSVALVVFEAYGGLRDGGAPRPVLLIIGTTIGSAALTGLAMWLASARRPTGPRFHTLFALLVGVPLGLMLWKIAWSAGYDGGLDRWPGRIGIPCLEISLLSGLGPLAGLIWLRRSTEANRPRLLGGVLGVLAGACAWVVTDLWCPVGHIPHLLLGHLLPLCLFALAGAAIGARWLRIRWEG